MSKIDDNIKTLKDYLKCTGVGRTEFTYALDSVISAMEKILEEEELLQKLITEYIEQDNRITAYPIYVMVQELVCIGVMASGYDVCCPFGDGETKTEYKHEDLEGSYDSENEITEALYDYYEEDEGVISTKANQETVNIEEINVGYIWHPVEFFLTVKGAEQYIKSNAHNHGKLRTYVSHFERRNFEMRKLLEIFGFKVKD